MSRCREAACAVALALLGVCAMVGVVRGQEVAGDGRRFYPDDPLQVDPDRLDLGEHEPAEHELSDQYDFLQNTIGSPGDHAGPATNVNTVGQVPDSSWFENRVGRRALSHEELVRGPLQYSGPQPPLLVTGRPGTGITPKFTVTDARGDTYLIKVDPPDWPGLASTADYVGTKLFWALGYHVPENYIHWLDPEALRISDEATWRDPAGYERSLRNAEIVEWLRGQPRSVEGTIRVLASRFLPGTPIGPRKFHGTRSDDPNDLFLHEARRDLRGMRVFAAWLNHDDSRAPNSFSALVEEDGRRFVRHYLIDFGSALGSRADGPQEPRAGYEYSVDLGGFFGRLLGLGIQRQEWERARYEPLAAVGRLEADFYQPWLWKPQYPNPAFDRMDAADAFWAASIAARVDDELIRGIVDSAQMLDLRQAEYLSETLIRRRDRTVRYWIARTNPLDDFVVAAEEDATVLRFDNAAIRTGATVPGERYRVRWSRLDNLADREEPVGEDEIVQTREIRVPENAWGPADDAGLRYAVVRVGVVRDDRPLWADPVVVTVRDRDGARDVVGVERPPQTPAIASAPPERRP